MKIHGRTKISCIVLIALLCMNLFPITNSQNIVLISEDLITAQAAEPSIMPGGFCMVSDSQNIQNGQLITVTGDTREIGLTHSSGSIPTDAVVTWLPYDENVINVNRTSNYKAVVSAVGPGYAQLAAIISYQGMDYQVYCQIYVPLGIDISNNVNSGNLGIVKNINFGDTSNNVGFQLLYDETDKDYTHYLVKLKNVAYQAGVTNMTTTVSPSGITVKAPAITWTSSDETVVKVDTNGILTAVGAGSAKISVETTTTYNGKTDKITFPVYVKPTGKLSGDTEAMKEYFEFTAQNKSFTIDTNAVKSSNLTWTVHKGNSQSGEVIPLETTKLLKMTLSDYSGSVTFSDVKAGTYYITARPKGIAENNSFIDRLEFKVIVPVLFEYGDITMNVGDFYSILGNSNLPGNDWYNFVSDNENIATVTQKDGLITAKKKGITTIRMNVTAAGMEGGATSQTINVNVVDGIGLNTTSATIYTGSKLPLVLQTSNNAAPYTWKSSDEKVATVDTSGVVTGIKEGSCVITVEQVIDGVTKRVTCNITVLQTVTKVTLNPLTKDISIGDNLTINASVEPKLNDVKLHWVSSDESIVKIQSAGNLSATVTGVKGGVAVISAINQDNIVVGSCLVNVFQPIEKITLSESSVSVPLSAKTFQLNATIEPYTAQNQEVIWQSTNNSVATVDSNGKVTLKNSGTASIVVTSKINANITATCNINVTKSVTGISIDQASRDMYVGETFRLTYVIKPSDSSNASVEWISTNTSVAQVDGEGRVSAKGVGSTVIILKTKDGGYMATCTIKVSRTATAVKLDVTELTLNVDDYYYLATTLTPADSTETTLTWESSDKKVATVSSTGKVTGRSAGKTVIMVKTKSGSTGYCTVNVLQPVTGIEISSEEETINVGDDLELSATVLPENSSESGVTWSSSNPKVAKVDKKGNVVGVAGGTAMISATSDEGNYKAYCMVTVEELVTSIKLNRNGYRLGKGKTFLLKATVSSKTATNKNLKWSSSKPSVATVDKNGRVKGIKPGWAVITVKATDGSGAEASCNIRVCSLVTSISVDTNYLSLIQGHSHKLKTTVTPSTATFKTPTYSSSDDKVAIVDQKGNITALSPGNCIITVKAKDSSGVKAICYVTVHAPIASTGVSVSESEIVMSPGESKAVAISIVPNNSTDTIIWSSDNPVVATVNAKTGRITAKGIGTANITIMTESGRKGTIKVFVVGLSKTSITLPQYTSMLINLEVEGAGSSNLKVHWDVDNQEIATVKNGKVTTKAIGTTYVYAIVNGRRLSCKVTVTKIP